MAAACRTGALAGGRAARLSGRSVVRRAGGPTGCSGARRAVRAKATNGTGSEPGLLDTLTGLLSGGSDGDGMRVEQDGQVLIDPVTGSKRFSNYFWATAVTGGGSGFLITGLSSYVGRNLVFFLDSSDVQFFPQGLVLSFYGTAGLLLALYLWLTIYWDVGSGYNEFNKSESIVRIFRRGFPGKNRRINLTSDLADVQAVKVEIKEGVNPRRVLYVRIKGKADIPLTRIGTPITLEELEGQAAELARFLQVPIEGL